MPLQNRVDPFGAIHAVSARGSLMGNRGIIHDSETRSLLKRRWMTKAWIICLCQFKGRTRTVMGPGSYTELFFRDEATALAAGHRPCFECQRKRARAFAEAFAAGNGSKAMRAGEIDAVLHGERLAAGNPPSAIEAGRLGSLPDGTMIAAAGKPYLIAGGSARRWTFAGYGPATDFDAIAGMALVIITPPATVAAIASGYRPHIARESAA